MATCFPPSWPASRKSIRRSRSNLASSSLRSSSFSWRPCRSSSTNVLDSHADNMESKRWDSSESWSMLLEEEDGDGVRNSSQSEQEEWMADLSELLIGNKFASGTNSRIYRGIYKQSACAVKIIKIPDQDEASCPVLEKQFTSEISMLSRLHHPNIVQFIAACKKPPVCCLITEYMNQGTLRMYLHKKGPYSLSTETILRLALDISHGMEYLHSKGIIHRDLKSDNLLLDDEMCVKVADFGTSCVETQCQKVKGNMGTYRWMAPEMMKEKPQTKKVDVYSFGIVLWELTTAQVPFQGMTPVQAAYAACEKNLRPPLSETCPPALNSLIQECWSVNPVKRPDFTCIVATLEKIDQQLKDDQLKDDQPVISNPELTRQVPVLEQIRVLQINRTSNSCRDSKRS